MTGPAASPCTAAAGYLVLALCLAGDQFQAATDSVIDAASTTLACRYELRSATSSAVTLLVDGRVAGSVELDRHLAQLVAERRYRIDHRL